MSFGIPEPQNTPFFASLVHDQSAAILVGLILVMITGALIGWLAQSRIRYFKRIKLRVASRKIQAKHLIQILEGLARTSCEQRVRELIGERLLEIIEQIMDINPIEPGVKVIHAATQRLMVLPAKQTTYDLSVADSDSDIKHLHRIILATIAQIKKMPRRGLVTYSECQALEKHLKMIYVQIEIDAHLQKADLAAEANDRGTASNHYRIAQNKLAQSKYHGSGKRDKMAEIGATIRALFETQNTN